MQTQQKKIILYDVKNEDDDFIDLDSKSGEKFLLFSNLKDAKKDERDALMKND